MAPWRFKDLCALGVALLAAASPAAALGEVGTFTDTELPDSGWTVTELLDDTVGDDGQFTALHLAGGGNPGGYRAVSNGWSHDGADWATVVGGHLRVAPDFDPTSDGPLGQIDLAIDVVTTQTTYATEAMLSFFPVLRQGEAYYAAGESLDSSGSWSRAEWLALEAGDFALYAGDAQAPAHPDFSEEGAALTFGVAVQSGPHQLAGAFITEGGLDNWTLTLRAPEPAGGGGGTGAAAGSGGTGGATGSGNGQGVGASGLGVGPSTLPPRDDGGCGCRLTRTSGRAPLGTLGLVGALLVVARRRRNAHGGKCYA